MCLERISRPLYAHQAYVLPQDQPSFLNSVGRIILSAARAFAIFATGVSTFGFIASGNPLFLGGAIAGGAISLGLFTVCCDDPITAVYDVIRLIGATTNSYLDAFSPRAFSHIPRQHYYEQPPIIPTYYPDRQHPIFDLTQRAPVGRRDEPVAHSTAALPVTVYNVMSRAPVGRREEPATHSAAASAPAVYDAASRAPVGRRESLTRAEGISSSFAPAPTIPIFRPPFPPNPTLGRGFTPPHSTVDLLSRAPVGRREEELRTAHSIPRIEDATDVMSRAQVGSRKDK